MNILFDQIDRHPSGHPEPLPNELESTVTITVDNEIWFQEYITIGELIDSLEHWLGEERFQNRLPYAYHSIDTEDNPILSLVCLDEVTWLLVSKHGRQQVAMVEGHVLYQALLDARAVYHRKLMEQHRLFKVSW